jgi:hypothetical protein
VVLGTRTCDTALGKALCPDKAGPEYPIQGRYTDGIYKYIEVNVCVCVCVCVRACVSVHAAQQGLGC